VKRFPIPASGTLPGAWRFVLDVQPQSPQQPWHARLHVDGGNWLDFHAPIELLRHLVQLGAHAPPPGRLK
jgi:hypothetical protein